MFHVGPGLMHLTRPLDPFWDMPRLNTLHLFGNEDTPEDLSRWTAGALRLLGLADRRVQQKRKSDSLHAPSLNFHHEGPRRNQEGHLQDDILIAGEC